MLRQAHPLARSSFLFPSPLAAKIFIATTPQMPFPLLEFIYFGLSSLNSEVYFPMRCRLYHNTVQTAPTFLPGPLPEARGFFCPSEKKPRPAPAPSSAAPGIRLFILLQSSRFLTLRGPVSPKRPVLPIHLRDRPRPSRPRPISPTSPEQNRCPFTPSSRPAPPLPTTLPRRRPATPPRTGLQARFAPRRSRSGP